MSFFTNNTSLKEITFNTNDVSSVYFNNNLVWIKFEWPGLANATWENVYALCKQKQSGVITEWPEDITIGATMTVNLSSPIVDYRKEEFTSFECEIIGIDIDGDGVLTFQTKYCIYMQMVDAPWQTYTTNPYVEIEWQDDELLQDNYVIARNVLRENCNNFYAYCDAKNYIKPLNKYTANYNGYSEEQKTMPTGKLEYVWLPSEFEIGVSEYSIAALAQLKEATLGVNMPYPKFTDAESREKKELKSSVNIGEYTVPWWLRSTSTTVSGTPAGSHQVCAGYSMQRTIKGSYANGTAYYGSAAGFAPCFAIG